MQELTNYFPQLTKDALNKFEQLNELYSYWNERINVISRKDIDELYIRHVLHSLAIAKYVQFKPDTKILDVGTGGGFPGIPLAILFPETRFLLVDSIAKKIKVVDEVISSLKLNNCRAEQQRAEKVKGKYDFVVTRAVAPLGTINNWVRLKINKTSKHKVKNGLICLKGGDLKEEIKPFKKRVIDMAINDFFTEPFFETKRIIHLQF